MIVRHQQLFFLFFLMLSTQAVTAAAPCLPIVLQCGYTIHPLGIDIIHPRLSWQLKDDRRGAVQQAYQLMVGTDSLALLQGRADAWNSGKMQSAKTNAVEYNGIALKVHIPANSTATVYFPVLKGEKIFESGKLLMAIGNNLRYSAAENDRAVYQAGAGTYSFEIR
jgi:hypothetical protein